MSLEHISNPSEVPTPSCTWEDVASMQKKYFSERMKSRFGTMLLATYGQEVTQRILQPECIEDTMRLLLLNFQYRIQRPVRVQSTLTHIKDVLGSMGDI